MGDNNELLENGWFYERSYFGKFSMGWKVKTVLHSEKSKFQQIDVLETESVGRLLLLDGKTMVSEKDEFVYHEVDCPPSLYGLPQMRKSSYYWRR